MSEDLAKSLTALGFAVVDTGGGCTAWRIALPRHGYLLITDGEGGASHDIDNPQACTIGIYDEQSECVCITGGALEPPTFACPRCQRTAHLYVIVTAEARLWEDKDSNLQTEVEGDHDWDDHAPMRCGCCEFSGEAQQFKTAKEAT